jgi:hypothetical protein
MKEKNVRANQIPNIERESLSRLSHSRSGQQKKREKGRVNCIHSKNSTRNSVSILCRTGCYLVNRLLRLKELLITSIENVILLVGEEARVSGGILQGQTLQIFKGITLGGS